MPQFLRNSGKGWVTAEYSSAGHRDPDGARVDQGPPIGTNAGNPEAIGSSLRTVVDLQALGERSVIVDCDVIQADGGTRTASITGAYVALMIAIRKMIHLAR